jgi:hypothetical protein
VGEVRNADKILVGNVKKGDNLEDMEADGRIILKFTFKIYDEGVV